MSLESIVLAGLYEIVLAGLYDLIRFGGKLFLGRFNNDFKRATRYANSKVTEKYPEIFPSKNFAEFIFSFKDKDVEEEIIKLTKGVSSIDVDIIKQSIEKELREIKPEAGDKLEEIIDYFLTCMMERLQEKHEEFLNTAILEKIKNIERILTKPSVNQQDKIENAYWQAVAFMSGDQYDDAYKILGNILNEEPGFYMAWLELGNVLLHKKKYEEAYNAYLTFEKHTTDTMELSKSWHNRANILSVQGEKKRALEMYNRVLKLRPNDFQPYFQIAQLLIEEENYDEASLYINKMLSLDLPHSFKILAYNLKLKIVGKQKRKEEAENLKLKIEEIKKCERLFSEGLKYAELKYYEKAIEKFNKVIEIEPENGSAYYNKGLALEHLQRFSEALDCYSKSISLNPEVENRKSAYSRCAYNIGVLLRSNNEPHKAIEYFDKALEYNPTFYECIMAKGDAFQDIEKYDESISLYNSAIKSEPNRAEAYISKGYSLYELGKKLEALKCLETALKIEPANPIAIHNKSQLLKELRLTSKENS